MSKEITLIIGGSAGLGEALAKEIAKKYKKEVLILGRNEENMKKISKTNKNISFYKIDITKNNEINSFINYLKEKYAIVNIVNSATVQNLELLEDISDKKFNESMNVNVNAPRKIITKIIKNNLLKEDARVLFISSTSRYNYQSGMGLYSMSKAASYALTNMLKKEYGNKYLFGSLYPGTLYNTKTAQNMADCKIEEIMNLRKKMKEFLHNNKQIRILSPDQAAEFVAWVLFNTEDNAFVNPINYLKNKENKALSTEEWDIRDCCLYKNCSIECGAMLRDLADFLGE